MHNTSLFLFSKDALKLIKSDSEDIYSVTKDLSKKIIYSSKNPEKLNPHKNIK